MLQTISDDQAQAYVGGGKIAEIYKDVVTHLFTVASDLSSPVPGTKLAEIAPQVGSVLATANPNW